METLERKLGGCERSVDVELITKVMKELVGKTRQFAGGSEGGRGG